MRRATLPPVIKWVLSCPETRQGWEKAARGGGALGSGPGERERSLWACRNGICTTEGQPVPFARQTDASGGRILEAQHGEHEKRSLGRPNGACALPNAAGHCWPHSEHCWDHSHELCSPPRIQAQPGDSQSCAARSHRVPAHQLRRPEAVDARHRHSAEMARTRSQTGGQAGPGFFERHDNVYLYVPNLIGAPQRLVPPPPAACRCCCLHCRLPATPQLLPPPMSPHQVMRASSPPSMHSELR